MPGDEVQITLGDSKRSDIAVNPISGTIRAVNGGVNVTGPDGTVTGGTEYRVEITDDQLPGNLGTIQVCDITQVTCLDCCDALDIRVTDLEWDIAALQVGAIPDLNNLQGLDNGDRVATTGYFLPFDGGGAEYYFDAGNSGVCDGCVVLDGPGGDNSPAEDGVNYPGASTLGRFVLINQKAIRPEQGGANLGSSGDAFRQQALRNTYHWTTPVLNLEGDADPTESELPFNRDAAFWKNTTSGKLLLAVNDDGTIKLFDPDGGGGGPGLTNWEESGFDFGPAAGNTTGNLTVPKDVILGGDARLSRAGSGHLTLRDGANPQIFKVYSFLLHSASPFLNSSTSILRLFLLFSF